MLPKNFQISEFKNDLLSHWDTKKGLTAVCDRMAGSITKWLDGLDERVKSCEVGM